jgi:UTP--glucose-1-phosphate uridylyltransferase
MPRIRKALILAAGYGTRFLPATKAVPKEMLPIVDRPVIQYIVEEALASGLDQIYIVTATAKRAVEDHFDRLSELEAALERKPEVLAQVQETGDIDIAFVRQKEMRGQADAILATKRFIGGEPFALFYPDDVIFGAHPAMRQLLDVHEKHGGAVLAVERVSEEDIALYGSIEAQAVEDGVYKVSRIVEKPAPGEAPSLLGTIGRYVMPSEIWPLLETTPESPNGEMFLTDTIQMLMDRGGDVFARELEGDRFDAGRPIGLIQASIYEGLRRPDIGPELRAYIERALD